MADDLAAVLAIVTFLAILFSYSFLESIINDLATSIGAGGGVPGEITGIIFLVAIGVGVLVYMRMER